MRPRPYVTVLAAVTSGCIATPPPLVMPGTVLGPRDSLALAFETGRRDAMLLHPARVPILMTLVPAAGVLIATESGEFWALPATMTTVTGGMTLRSYRATRAPLPAPPDSMRVRYGLDAPDLWRRYRLGFEGAIEERRRLELNRNLRMSLASLSLWAIYIAFRRAR